MNSHRSFWTVVCLLVGLSPTFGDNLCFLGIAWRGSSFEFLCQHSFAFNRLIQPKPIHVDQRLPRDQLLVFRGTNGELRQAKTPEEWLVRRQEILDGVEAIMGKLPGGEKQCDPNLQVHDQVDCGMYIRHFVSYLSEPDCRVPAYLCVPKKLLAPGSTELAPAVLCLHGTDDRFGHAVAVGLGEDKNQSCASELAERGFVTLAPSYPLLADYQPDLAAMGWSSGSLKAVWDNIRGIDLLLTLPYVRPESIAVIGHSLGGHNAVFTAFFEKRISAVISNCGLDSFLDYYGGVEQVWEAGRGWTQTRYMPRLAGYKGKLEEIPFDFQELVGGLAPRRVLIIAPRHDQNFRVTSVERVLAAARPVFDMYGCGENLKVLHPDCPHDFPVDIREQAYEWLIASLRVNLE